MSFNFHNRISEDILSKNGAYLYRDQRGGPPYAIPWPNEDALFLGEMFLLTHDFKGSRVSFFIDDHGGDDVLGYELLWNEDGQDICVRFYSGRIEYLVSRLAENNEITSQEQGTIEVEGSLCKLIRDLSILLEV